MLLTDTLGEHAVSKASAESLGAVDGVVIDAAGHRITAVQLGKGRKARVVPWESISGIGSAALIVDDDESARAPDEREQRFTGGDVGLIGSLVLSDRGNARGKVVDLEYEEDTGRLVSIRTESETVAADRLRAIGTYAWVVAAGDDEPAKS